MAFSHRKPIENPFFALMKPVDFLNTPKFLELLSSGDNVKRTLRWENFRVIHGYETTIARSE